MALPKAAVCRTGGWYRISIAVDDLNSLPFRLQPAGADEARGQRSEREAHLQTQPGGCCLPVALPPRCPLYAGMDSALRWILHDNGSANYMEAPVPKTPVLMIAAALLTVSPAFAQNAATTYP